jgi:glyoxylase I family protein
MTPQPPEFALRGVSHVSLSVTDLERSLAFYRDLLGLPVLMEPFEGSAFDGREAMVLVGRVALALQSHRGGDTSVFDPRRTGLDHLAFHLSDRSHLDDWAERLGQHGVPCSEVKKVAFGWNIEFKDPDGIQLEFFALD